ncbi:mitochondrial [Pyrenophora seminiperda CCB06]|uniref:MICOS complex subunit n=1 Tax=Pyrenophora seminiperda CCB06 TaxID=1302712 RepID=A0A3M7M7Z4_9PLEO|nr:mitochondrial [Pyrenophora seminiperda CCB06]
MAFRPLLRQRAIAPTMAVLSALAVSAPRPVDAEERPDDRWNRKPIYDDMPIDTTAPTSPSLTEPSNTPSTPELTYRPTPTDRLAVQIGRARMALYDQAVRGEKAVDNALTETLRLEHSFTSTIRSLAPPRESGEKILPGALYVLVSAMAGSIVTRNRNILLRASVPVAVGITAANIVLPITSKNVGDLIWTYEERYPVVADTHLRMKNRISQFIETGKAHAQGTVGMVEGKLAYTRENLEGWVKKGR